jgi:peptidoglycan/xylan/chitin deacetylase (PgdA/CDA1 family)
MRRQLKRTARVALKAASAAIDPLLGPFPGPRILIYHQVGVDFGREMEVSTEAFAEHIDWMQANGEIVDLETAIERRGEPDADKLFVLTFDDGFEDVYDNAFPLMKERDIPFTLYLTTRPIETGEPIDPRYPGAKPLTWDQVNEMAATGLVTAGAHTHTHLNLRSATVDQIADELDTSNELIFKRTGISPRHFTYPWGWWSEAAHRAVSSSYESATLGSGSPLSDSTDIHCLSRVPLQRTDGARLALFKLRFGGRTEDQLRRLRHQYKGP